MFAGSDKTIQLTLIGSLLQALLIVCVVLSNVLYEHLGPRNLSIIGTSLIFVGLMTTGEATKVSLLFPFIYLLLSLNRTLCIIGIAITFFFSTITKYYSNCLFLDLAFLFITEYNCWSWDSTHVWYVFALCTPVVCTKTSNIVWDSRKCAVVVWFSPSFYNYTS